MLRYVASICSVHGRRHGVRNEVRSGHGVLRQRADQKRYAGEGECHMKTLSMSVLRVLCHQPRQ